MVQNGIHNLAMMPSLGTQAQQEMWSELAFAMPGAIAYDIRPSDGNHPSTLRPVRRSMRGL